jgi:hypothetical protein
MTTPALRTLLAAALLIPLAATAANLQPFTTDGCSDFPNGTLSQNTLWLSCCIEHDYAYWQGGTRQERLAADKALRDCVAAVGEPAIAQLMLAGVRVGGSPHLPTPFRWGYGWPFPRGYKALSEEEREQVRTMESNHPIAHP